MNIYHKKNYVSLMALCLLVLSLPAQAQMFLNASCSWRSSHNFALTGNVGMRNTYTGTTFTTHRPIRVIWVDANNRWETQIDQDNDGIYETISAFNTIATLPNPPSSDTYTWSIVLTGGVCDDFFNLVGTFTQNVLEFGIRLQGNGIEIANNSTTAQLSNHTFFGVSDGVNAIVRTFTIRNLATVTHTLTGIAPNFVTLTGSSDFQVITQPSTDTIPAGGSVTFQVRFLPTGADGLKNATVSIANSQATANPYIFAIQGNKAVVDNKRGNAIRLNGFTQAIVSSQVATSATTNVTIEGWVNFNFIDTGSPICIFYNGNNFANGYGLYLIGTTIQILVGGITLFDTGITPDVNIWIHLALVGDNSNWNVYKNGNSIGTFPIQGNMPSGNFRIGSNISISGEFLNGTVDEVRIWEVARTQTQLRQHMHLTLPPSAANLVAYYQFNEAAGNAIDVIRGNDGILRNSPIRVASTLAVGGGVSKVVSVTNIGAGSEIDLTTTNLEIDFANTSVNPNGEIALYQITAEAPLNSTIPTNPVANSYWVVRNFGVNTGLIFDNIRLRTVINTTNEAVPTTLKLYYRAIDQDIHTMTNFSEVADANSANVTTTEANFDLPTNTALGEFFVGSVARPVDKVRGNMVSLNGVSGHLAYNEPLITLTSGFTLEAWLNLANNNNTTLLSNGNGNGFHLLIEANEYKIFVTGIGVYNTGVAPITGAWSHIALVHDGGAWRLFQNGTQVYVSGAVPVNTPTTSFAVGAPSILGSYTNVRIDELRVWETARTFGQIRNNMHLTLKGNETNLRAYYQFNEVSGVAFDKIGSRDLALLGDAIYTSSTVSVSNGTSARAFVNGVGTYNFAGTNCSLHFAGTVPIGDVVVNRLEGTVSGTALEGLSTFTRYYWVINNYGTNTGLTVTPTFVLGSNNISAIDEITPSNLRLQRRTTNSNGSWTQIAATSADASNGTVTFNPINSFSEFGVGSIGSSPLPITLLGFKGERTRGQNGERTAKVRLDWTTAQEINNKGFAVETSEDALNFRPVAFVDGKGHNIHQNTYQLVVNNANDGYYRLKQIDFNGQFEYSPIIFVAGVEAISSFKIYPNPTQELVYVELDNQTNPSANVEIYNTTGLLVKSIANTQQILSIQVSDWSKGVYLIKVGNETKRFVIE